MPSTNCTRLTDHGASDTGRQSGCIVISWRRGTLTLTLAAMGDMWSAWWFGLWWVSGQFLVVSVGAQLWLGEIPGEGEGPAYARVRENCPENDRYSLEAPRTGIPPTETNPPLHHRSVLFSQRSSEPRLFPSTSHSSHHDSSRLVNQLGV